MNDNIYIQQVKYILFLNNILTGQIKSTEQVKQSAYVYVIVQKSTKTNWYIGKRTKKGCYPTEKYMGSSKTLKKLIKDNPDDFQKLILYVGSIEVVNRFEPDLLTLMSAAKDDNSFNKTNGDLKFDTTGISLPKEKNPMYGKTGNKNPQYKRPTVYDMQLDQFTTVSKDEYEHLKNIRYFNPMFDRLPVFDIDMKIIRNISKEEYQKYKNVKYFNPNSKVYKNWKLNNSINTI